MSDGMRAGSRRTAKVPRRPAPTDADRRGMHSMMPRRRAKCCAAIVWVNRARVRDSPGSISDMMVHDDGQSRWWSGAIRTARSRTSGANLFVVLPGHAPDFQGASTKVGRFRCGSLR